MVSLGMLSHVCILSCVACLLRQRICRTHGARLFWNFFAVLSCLLLQQIFLFSFSSSSKLAERSWNFRTPPIQLGVHIRELRATCICASCLCCLIQGGEGCRHAPSISNADREISTVAIMPARSIFRTANSTTTTSAAPKQHAAANKHQRAESRQSNTAVLLPQEGSVRFFGLACNNATDKQQASYCLRAEQQPTASVTSSTKQ